MPRPLAVQSKTRRRPPARRQRYDTADVWLTFTLTLVFLSTSIFLAIVPTQNQAIEELTGGLSTLTKFGAGAIFGLVQGGRRSHR